MSKQPVLLLLTPHSSLLTAVEADTVKHLVCLAMLVAGGLAAAHAQDPRVEPPKSPAEWFGALEFELSTGQFEQGVFYLRGFLAANPTDKDFVAIERDRGFAAFLRLRTIK